jgi:oligopeptide transport system substrate-binding protein
MKNSLIRLGWLCLLLSFNIGLPVHGQAQEIAFNLLGEPVSADPLYAVGEMESILVTNLYEGLVRWDNGHLAPGAAANWTVSKDGRSYRFNLRQSYWSDGSLVTAKNFKDAWLRVMDPKNKGAYSPIMEIIAGVSEYRQGNTDAEQIGIQAVGKNILKVQLTRPCAHFLSFLTMPIFMPVKYSPQEKRIATGECTNGPYRISSHERRSFILLEANRRYRGSNRPSVKRIKITFFPKDTVGSIYASGLIQSIQNPSDRDIRRYGPTSASVHVPTLGSGFIFFNLHRPPFDRPEVRKAFALVTNRELLVNRFLPNQAVAASGFIPFGLNEPGGVDFRQNDKRKELSLDGIEARKLLWQVGYPGEVEFPPIDLIYREGDLNRQMVELIANMWRIDLGIQVETVGLTWSEYKSRCEQGRFYTARAGWQGDYPDPMAFLELFRKNSPGNFGRYRDSEYEKWLDIAEQKGYPMRYQALHAAEERLLTDLPILPLYFNTNHYLVTKKISGLKFSPQGYPLLWTLKSK